MSDSKFRRRLTPEDIDTILRLKASGVPTAEVARQLKITGSTVTKYVRGVEPKPEPPRPPTADELLLSAYPWAWTLTATDRAVFASELAHPRKYVQEAEIDRLVLRWRAEAERRFA